MHETAWEAVYLLPRKKQTCIPGVFVHDEKTGASYDVLFDSGMEFCQSSCSDHQMMVLPMASLQLFIATEGMDVAPTEGIHLQNDESPASVAE